MILLLAALLRLWGLTRGDPINDEVLMGFRSVGLIDFDLAEFQTTPWEWFDTKTGQDVGSNVPKAYRLGGGIPWWAYLSWHDHPPLVFYAQHFSFALFGENLFALRFPSALFGVVSVYLVYLLGKILTSPNPSFVRRGNREKTPPPYEGGGVKGGGALELAAFCAAVLYATTLNAVYISRTGMQESHVIFFILISCYFFLRALENPRYFIWTGVAIGLGFLAKYTVLFFTAPLFLLYLLVFYRKLLRQKQIWLGACIILLFATPVIVYNIMLYRAVGHFDFQFSSLFFQDHPVWQVQPGKEIGSVGERVTRFMSNLIATNSWLFLMLAFLAILEFFISLFRNARAAIRQNSFLIFAIGTMFFLILGIGPSYRFLTMLTPFLALAAGYFLVALYHILMPENSLISLRTNNINSRTGFERGEIELAQISRHDSSAAIIPAPARNNPFASTLGRARKARGLMLFVVMAITILFEIFYSWNNQIAYYPKGSSLVGGSWLESKVKYENYNWGYNELARYFENEFRGKIPAVTFNLQYQFLEQLRDKELERGVGEGRALYPALVVVYGNFDKGGKLWALDRLHIYHAWPVINLATYYDYLSEQGNDYYQRSGFEHFYFVLSTNTVATPEFNSLVFGIDPIAIKNPRGDAAFLVYKN